MRKLLKRILPKKITKTIRDLKKIMRNSKIDLDDYYLLPKSMITYAQDLLYTYNNAGFMQDPFF